MPDFIVIAPHIFGIGRIEHEQALAGQSGMQALHFIERQIGAGRIVGIGKEDDARLRRHAREYGVDIGV